MKPETRRYLLEKAANVVGALIYIMFAAAFILDFMRTQRMSCIFSLIIVTFFVFFFLVRDIPKQVSLSPYDWFIGLCGTFIPLLLRPAPAMHDTLILHVLQIIGMCISIAGILSLNKSLGLVAANRGVKTFWAYEYVRHPIYVGYFINLISFWVQNITPANTVAILLFMTFEILRIFAEEKYLSRDPAYLAYMKKVRWRMVPGLF